jgi:FdrA protein
MPIIAVKITIDKRPTPKLFVFVRAKTIKGIEKLFDIKMILNIVKKNFFRDSVQMMQFSQQLKDEQGVVDAAIVMGTDLNKNTLKNMDLLTEDGISATENDTLISINCKDENSLNNTAQKAEQLLVSDSAKAKNEFNDLSSALDSFSNANIASLSIPGQFVKEMAVELINKQLNLFVFSDHVPLEDEIYLKNLALENNVLFMGPEAGTSILNGTVFGFGNRIRKGSVGIIGASGTGIQEASTMIDLFGEGISHAIGVGGRDLRNDIGGVMTMKTMEIFENDPNTKAVLLVSKPVDNYIRNKIINKINNFSKKNYVLCLVGDNENREDTDKIKFSKSIQTSVLKILKLLDDNVYKKTKDVVRNQINDSIKLSESLSKDLNEGQKFIRGFFAGGTLCYESKIILEQMIGKIYSNLSSDDEYSIKGNVSSKENTLIDFGEEEFTSARPHPIIDPLLRRNRILEDANDPNVGVIIIDIICGINAAKNTMAFHAETIKKAIEIAREQGRKLSVFTYICGTENDVSKNELKLLADSGAKLFTSNALMSFAAALVVKNLDDNSIKKIRAEFLEGDVF